MSKGFVNFEIKNDIITIDKPFVDNVKQAISNLEFEWDVMGTVSQLILNVACSTDLTMQMSMGVIISITMLLLNTTTIQDVIMGAVDCTYDWFLNAADAGNQKSKAQKLTKKTLQLIIDDINEECAEQKENNPDAWSKWEIFANGFNLTAASTAAFKKELSTKSLTFWNDDEVTNRLRDLISSGSVEILLQLWNRDKDTKLTKANNEFKLSGSNVVIIFSNIQVCYSLFLQIFCGSNGFIQRFTIIYPPEKHVTSADITRIRHYDNNNNNNNNSNNNNNINNDNDQKCDQNIWQCALELANILKPIARRHLNPNGQLMGPCPVYYIEYADIDVARAEHSRLKSLFLYYLDKNQMNINCDDDLKIKPDSLGFRKFMNDVKLVLGISPSQMNTLFRNIVILDFTGLIF